MNFVLHKKKQRDASGKASVFIINGQELSRKQIERYVRRNDPQSWASPPVEAPTPPHITYMSPSPPQSPIQTNDEESMDMELRSQVVLPPSPTLPDGDMATLERLVHSVEQYCSDRFESRSWRYDASQNLVNVRDQNIVEDASVYQFYDLFRTATRLMSRRSFQDGRIALDKGMDLVPSMFRNEGPRTLESIFSTLLLLQRQGYHDIYTLSSRHISLMGREILSPKHPLAVVCACLTYGNPRSEDMILEAWQCLSKCFTKHLGKLSPAALMCHNNYIRAAYGQREPERVERILRDLLLEAQNDAAEHSLAIMAITLELINILIAQQKFAEAIATADHLLDISRSAGDFQLDFEAKALEVKANAMYLRLDGVPAEVVLRNSIAAFARLRGETDSVVMNLKIRLETWLQERGEFEYSREIDEEISEWLRPSVVAV